MMRAGFLMRVSGHIRANLRVRILTKSSGLDSAAFNPLYRELKIASKNRGKAHSGWHGRRDCKGCLHDD